MAAQVDEKCSWAWGRRGCYEETGKLEVGVEAAERCLGLEAGKGISS